MDMIFLNEILKENKNISLQEIGEINTKVNQLIKKGISKAWIVNNIQVLM